MDEDCTIPQYEVVSYCEDLIGFQRRLNQLAAVGYEVSHFAVTGSGTEYFTALMVKRVSRLEVLVKEGKVVQ